MTNDRRKDIERCPARRGDGSSGSAEKRTRELLRRADDEGLLDVAYTEVDSPFGQLVLAATTAGPGQDRLPVETTGDAGSSSRPRSRRASWRRRRASTRRAASSTATSRASLQKFDLPLDWQLTRGFRRKVLRATARIPYGKTRSYTEMATKAGSPRAVRATGTALGSNPLPIVVPCHRVLRTGGALGGYGGGLEVKQALLRARGRAREAASPPSSAGSRG